MAKGNRGLGGGATGNNGGGGTGVAGGGGADGGGGVSFSERDELLAGGGETRRRKRSKHRWLKRSALALLILIVLLGAGVWFLGPALAEKYAPGIVASQSRKQIEGAVEIDNLSLSWTGAQQARKIRLLDPAGNVVADLNASIDRGLIGLATGWQNLGTIDLDGTIDIVANDDGTTNLSRATTPRNKPPSPTTPPGNSGSSSGSALADLVAHANLNGVAISYRKSPDAEPIKATIDGVAALDHGSVQIDLTGVTNLPDAEPIKLTLVGKDVFDALGQLQLARSDVDGSFTFALGDDGFVELMRTLTPDRDWAAAIAAAQTLPTTKSDEGLRADINFVVKNGKLGVDPATPAYARGRLVPPIIRAFVGEESLREITEAPSATLAINKLDIPLPDFAAGGTLLPDMRGGSIKGTIETTRVVATMMLNGETESLIIQPLKSTFGTDDFADGIGLIASTSWLRNGQPAGDFSIDASAKGLLDPQGRWKWGVKQADGKPGEPDDLRAQVIANDLPTPIADALVDLPEWIILSEDVGPTADMELVLGLEPGASASSAEGRGKLISLRATGAHASVSAEAIFIDDRIASRGEGVVIAFDRGGNVVRRLAGEAATVTGDGRLTASIPSFELPLTGKDKTLDLALASAKADLHATGMQIIKDGETIDVDDLHTTLTLARGGTGRIELDYQLRHNGREFGPTGQVSVKNLFAQNPASSGLNLMNAEFSGQITAADIPTSLLALVMTDEQAAAAREALGASAGLVIRASGASATAKGELATIELTSASGTTVKTAWNAREGAWSFGPTQGSLVIGPKLFASVDEMFDITTLAYDALGKSDTPHGRLTLDSVVVAELSAQPVTIALDEKGMPAMRVNPSDGTKSIDFIGTRQASLTVPNAISLSGLPNPVDTASGTPGTPIAIQIRGLQAGYSAHPNSPRDNETSLKASLYDPSNTSKPIAIIDTALRGNEIPVEARITQIDTVALDRIIARPGMIEGAIGSPHSVTATVERPKDVQETLATAQIDSPRLKTGPITLARSADKQRTNLVRPVVVAWSPARQWFDQYALKGGDQDWRVRLVGDISLPMSIDRLTLGAPGKMLDPAVFALTARAEIPSLTLATKDGQQETIRNLKTTVATTDTPGTVTLKLTADGAQQTQIVSADMRVVDLLTAEGGLNTESARISGTLKGEVPTLLVDTAMGQQGLLVDTLGHDSTADLTLTAVSMAADNGAIAGVLRSNNASVQLSGDIGNAVLKVNNDVRAEMSVITDAASRRLFAAAFPFLNSFEKTAQDRPAIATATGLQLPLDGDMRKLNGTINIDLGTVKFKTDPKLAPLLKAIKARPAGEIGQKVPPFVANITNGVIRYDEIILPIGDVTMRTSGKVNLVSRKIELVIMVPFAAVSDDLAATVGRLPFVGDIAVVPLKVVGDLGSPRVEFDPELLIKNALEKNPIGSILDQLNNDRKKDDKKKDEKKQDKPNN